MEGERKVARVSTACWYTNLPVIKHKEPIDLIRHYTKEEYPKYDNYDAINVNTYTEIPYDYEGIIGVPITFLDKFCPEQFEILGTSTFDMPKGAPYINGKRIYERVLIRNKKPQKP